MSTRRGGAKSKGGSGNRSNTTYDAKKVAAHEGPPNHPQENFPEHRTFLARSLTRNDEDLGALVDVNRTLHVVRQNIVDACGEELLLDLGEGLYQLTPCGRDITVTPLERPLEMENDPRLKTQRTALKNKLENIDDERKLLCVDFLLRVGRVKEEIAFVVAWFFAFLCTYSRVSFFSFLSLVIADETS